MSEELLNPPEPVPDEDVNTTPPNPPQSGGKGSWSMPEPVFRKTSGYLPQGFEKRFSQDEIKSEVDDDTSTASMPRPQGLAEVEPQPEITEMIEEVPPSATEVPEPKKGGVLKVIFSLFGLLIAFALVLIFIAVVYYLFLMPSSSDTF